MKFFYGAKEYELTNYSLWLYNQDEGRDKHGSGYIKKKEYLF
jgi:hypothetical protein